MSPEGQPASSRRFLAVPIAVLCGSALIAISLILAGDGIDETSARVLGTAVSLAVASLAISACLLLVRRQPALELFGYLGMLVVAVALLFGVGVIWQLGDDSSLAHPAGISFVLAVACAHASLLLATVQEGETDAIRLVRAGTLGAMALLAILLCVEISSRGPDVSAKAIGVLGVLYLLGSLLLPLMRTAARSGKPAATPAAAMSIPPVPPGVGLDQVIEQLRGSGFEVVAGPAPTQGTHGPAQGVAFRDSHGRLLELTLY